LLSAPLTARRAGLAISAVTVLATVAAGVLLWLVDRSEFPNVGLGLWWAVQTVTTVGYGDEVPTTAHGRAIAAVVMVLGIGFLSVFTAAVTAAFVESARRRLRGDELADVAERLDAIGERLDRIEAKLGERA
ncbi:MAG: potassium channel family protein, partial [Gaiellaceae bacterium]